MNAGTLKTLIRCNHDYPFSEIVITIYLIYPAIGNRNINLDKPLLFGP